MGAMLVGGEGGDFDVGVVLEGSEGVALCDSRLVGRSAA